METKMNEMSAKDLLDKGLYTPEVQQEILKRVKETGATHLVLFEVLDLGSPNLGHCAILMIGPGMTYKSIKEVIGKHLGDVPSRFMYPTAWAAIP